MWKYIELSNTLAGLYFRINDIVALLQKAGLSPANFVLDGSSAKVIWTLLLNQLEHMNKIPVIVEAALADYSDNPVLLDYKNNRPVIRKSIYAGEQPAWKGSPGQREKLTGAQNTLLPVSFLELGMAKAKCVARIVTPEGVGSGFLISAENHFLTNNHIWESASIAGKSTVRFNYQKTIIGLTDEYKDFEIDDSGFQTSVTDDWSVVKIKGDPVKIYGYLNLVITEVRKNDFVNIIQHPGGEHKQIGLYHNLVTYADSNIVQYLTDTLPGSSGSPVFNSDWEVVALHHSGGWIEEPGTSSPIMRNEGTNMNKIRETLLAKGFNL